MDYRGSCVDYVFSILKTKDRVISKQRTQAFIVGLKIELK